MTMTPMSGVVTSVRRSVVGAPRRSCTIVAIVAIIVAVTAAQVQVAAGLQRSVSGALGDPAQRRLVVAAPLAAWGSPSVDRMSEATQRIGSLRGVVVVGTAVRFVDAVLGRSAASGQVGWAMPSYLRVVASGPTAASASSATAAGSAALLPKALRAVLGTTAGGAVVVGSTTVVDLGDPPSSFADPGLSETALVPLGSLGASATFDTGSALAAVLFDHVPTDRDARLVSAAMLPDSPGQVAVISRGSMSTSAGRIEAIAGSSGRIAVVIAATAGWLIIGALQLTMAQRRRGELAVRRALGATPFDLAAASVGESAMLGAVGGVVGVGAAGAALVLVIAHGRPALAPTAPVASMVAIVVAAAATTLAGIVPTIVAVRNDPADVLRSLGDT